MRGGVKSLTGSAALPALPALSALSSRSQQGKKVLLTPRWGPVRMRCYQYFTVSLVKTLVNVCCAHVLGHRVAKLPGRSQTPRPRQLLSFIGCYTGYTRHDVPSSTHTLLHTCICLYSACANPLSSTHPLHTCRCVHSACVIPPAVPFSLSKHLHTHGTVLFPMCVAHADEDAFLEYLLTDITSTLVID